MPGKASDSFVAAKAVRRVAVDAVKHVHQLKRVPVIGCDRCLVFLRHKRIHSSRRRLGSNAFHRLNQMFVQPLPVHVGDLEAKTAPLEVVALARQSLPRVAVGNGNHANGAATEGMAWRRTDWLLVFVNERTSRPRPIAPSRHASPPGARAPSLAGRPRTNQRRVIFQCRSRHHRQRTRTAQ